MIRLRNTLQHMILFTLAAAVCACASLNLTQNAEVTYSSFVDAESAAATLMQSSEISDSLKTRIQNAHRTAKPLGDALYAALVTVKENPSADTSDLHRALTLAKPAIAALAGLTLEKAIEPPNR